jgi:L-ascorbate metabolism protein UlaG (beta-lactamase superfamily)
VQVVDPGQAFDVGLPVTAVGERHAVIHPDLPRFDNSGFLVDVRGTRVYHPGDSFTPAGVPVDVLLLPVHAPWCKISEVADFARAVGARRSVAVHDGLLNATGHGVVGRVLHGLLDTDEHSYQRVEPGSVLDL